MSRSEFEPTNFGRFRMAITPIKVFKCDLCDHVWLSRDRHPNNPPIACARCKSHYWNRNALKQNNTKQEVRIMMSNLYSSRISDI